MSGNPMRDVTIADIKQYLNNEGVVLADSDFAFAEEHDALKYIGYVPHHHRFLIAFEDDENEGNLYVSIVYVWLGRNGKLCADFGGNPVFESADKAAIMEYIEERCN